MSGRNETSEQHVIPRADVITHDVTEDCPCGPDATFESGGVIYIHHSLDNREAKEIS